MAEELGEQIVCIYKGVIIALKLNQLARSNVREGVEWRANLLCMRVIE